jgi:hypothetical protein
MTLLDNMQAPTVLGRLAHLLQHLYLHHWHVITFYITPTLIHLILHPRYYILYYTHVITSYITPALSRVSHIETWGLGLSGRGMGRVSRLPPKSVPLLVRTALGVAGLPAIIDPLFIFLLFLSCPPTHLVSFPSLHVVYLTLCSPHVFVRNCLL